MKKDSTVSVGLSKAQIAVLKPALQQLVRSYSKHLKGASPFAYPFRMYPPSRGFDRGTFNESMMQRILNLERTLKTNGASRLQLQLDTFELRGVAFGIRTYVDFVRFYIRQQRTVYGLRPKQRIRTEYVAELRANSVPVIHAVERHMKRANRALLQFAGREQYDGLMATWKAHLRWMRLHISHYKPLGKRAHGPRKRQQRDLDELMEMAKLAVRSEGHRAPRRIELRKLIRLYARYSRAGRPGYWSVRSLLENRNEYRAQWTLAQFVIDRCNSKELTKS